MRSIKATLGVVITNMFNFKNNVVNIIGIAQLQMVRMNIAKRVKPMDISALNQCQTRCWINIENMVVFESWINVENKALDQCCKDNVGSMLRIQR